MYVRTVCHVMYLHMHVYVCSTPNTYVAHQTPSSIPSTYVDMAPLFLLPETLPEQLVHQIQSGQNTVQARFSLDLSLLCFSHLTSQARKLKVGSSLPRVPAKVSTDDLESRLNMLRGLSQTPFQIVQIEMDAETLQQKAFKGNNKPVKDCPGIWSGEVSLTPSSTSILHVKPFTAKLKPLCMYVQYVHMYVCTVRYATQTQDLERSPCAYICVCTYVCTRGAYVCTNAFVRLPICMYVFEFTVVHTYTYVWRECTYVGMCVCIRIPMLRFVAVRIYMYMLCMSVCYVMFCYCEWQVCA